MSGLSVDMGAGRIRHRVIAGVSWTFFRELDELGRPVAVCAYRGEAGTGRQVLVHRWTRRPGEGVLRAAAELRRELRTLRVLPLMGKVSQAALMKSLLACERARCVLRREGELALLAGVMAEDVLASDSGREAELAGLSAALEQYLEDGGVRGVLVWVVGPGGCGVPARRGA